MKNLFSILLLFIAVISCDSNDSEDIIGEPAEKYFPLKIGNKWVYSFSTESENAIIERIIKINITHQDGSNIWGYSEAVQVSNPDTIEPVVGYNTIKSDGLYYYSSEKNTLIAGTNILCAKKLLLKSPVSKNIHWELSSGGNSSVVNIFSVKVLGNTFPNSVLVVTNYNSQSIDSVWYAPNVGMIKKVVYSSIGQSYQSVSKWEIMEYVLF